MGEVRAGNETAGVQVDVWIAIPHWFGERLDVVWAIDVLRPQGRANALRDVDRQVALWSMSSSRAWGTIVPGEVTRRAMERWLLTHGFRLLPGKKTSHQQYEAGGLKIALPGHGPQDLTKKHVALIVRQLVAAGFDRNDVLRELKGH